MSDFSNQIFCEDCFDTMKRMIENGFKVDCILTSPPYNTSKYGNLSNNQKDNRNRRYDIFTDEKTDEEYIEWTLELFDCFDKILADDKVIIYNIGYGNEKNELMWKCIYEIITKSNFTIVEDIIWKKRNAVPNVSSPNKLTRIVEHILIFCRKSEYMSFESNKKFTKFGRNGQKYYENKYNFIEAKNNDGKCELNKATFSTELVLKLLDIYVPDDSIVYDPFIGTGTTANACMVRNLSYIGSEISEKQVEYARGRLLNSTLNKWMN